MKDTPVQSVQAHNSSPNVVRHRDHLKPGSPVLVRIISAKGGGKFEASVAGARIILSSTRDLKAGDTFTGKIGLKNGLITINPADSTGLSTLKEVFTTNIIETGGLFDSVSSPALASLLASLNLPSDNLSFKILLQFKQLGLKLDPATMKKIRKEAEKAKNPEKKLEELVNKAQKKIENGHPEIESDTTDILDKEKDRKEPYVPLTSNKIETDWIQEIKEFIRTVISGDLENTPGELTIMNHLGFFKDRSSENTWITIPFEITNPFEETINGNGKIMLLLGSTDKSLKQINIHADYSGQKYRFAVFTKPGSSKIKKIAFSKADCEDSEKEVLKLQDVFASMGKEISAEFVPFEKVDGFASGLENFTTAEGLA